MPLAHLSWPEFFKQLWQVAKVGEAGTAGQHQGLGETLLVEPGSFILINGLTSLACVRQPLSTCGRTPTPEHRLPIDYA